MTLEFAHLHVASSYSLRYGTATPKALARRAADLGMPALALTDRDALYGAFKHVRACADAGIKPLLGADLAVRPEPAAELDAHAGTDLAGTVGGRVTLLAVGRQGWASLCRLVSAAHAPVPEHPAVADRTGTPAVTRELIAEHAAGLVLLLGPASDVGQAVAARRPDLARRILDRWRWLGCETVIEVVDHLAYKSTVRAARLAELARDARIPAVLSNAVRYLDRTDSQAAQVLDAARHLVPLGSPKLGPHNGRAYLASPADMADVAARVVAAMTGTGGGPRTADAATRLLATTAELARRCVIEPRTDLGIGLHHLPETEGGIAEQQQELRDRCEHAILHGRYRTARPENRPRGVSRLRAARNARDRLEDELDIIARTGMAPYFLTVADVADRIRAAGIRCAIRGSGAGSFVNHLLGISAIDPLEHDLLMERFLSSSRATLPDIDLDVESARRLDAYRVIFDAYGTERTACVSMMETYRARSAIRDVAAAMSFPPDEIGAIAKAFPHIRARNITAALGELPELRRSRLNNAQLAAVFQLAEQLDGLPRHVAMHPCGVLLSNRTLLDRTAVQSSGEGFPLSQLDKDDAEIAGVIKLDVLGVRMQSAIAHTLAEIERGTGERIDIEAIRRDDAGTYAMIRRSNTIGCFQIESPGQRELVKKLAPRDVSDLIVDISLFRPGPVNSDMITPFLRARHGLAQPRYPHEKLVAVLAETGGVVVFHEQVLRIIHVLTGCGLAEADLVRRHLSSEDGPARTAPWFRAQALARGFDPATVERVWEVVAAFGGFGFCKAHAAAFAIPVYQSAWLKRHHPAAFYAGVLTHDPGMYPKRVILQDARLSGIQVLPLDINASAAEWRTAKPLPGTDAATPVDPANAGHSGDVPALPRRGPSAAGAVVPARVPDRHRNASDAGDSQPRDAWFRRATSPVSDSGSPVSDSGGSRVSSRRGRRAAGASALRADDQPSEPRAIRCSLREVKGISDAEVDRIVAGQPYTSLRDFWDRARPSRPVAERLALLGAFDSLYTAPALPSSTMTGIHVISPAPFGPAQDGGPRMADSATHSSWPPHAGESRSTRTNLAPPPALALVPPSATAPVPAPAPLSPSAPTRRDLLARVGVLARQSAPARAASPVAPDLFAGAGAFAEGADGMADLVPAGQLRDLDVTERVEAELEILGFDVSRHVLDFYADLLTELHVVRSKDLDDCAHGETVLVAGVKVATQTPAVRSGQRIIFASLDDAAGLVDLAFFESVQDRCAARLFGSWLLLVRGRVRRAGAGPLAVTVNGCECWDIPALDEIRVSHGMPAVRAAMTAGDVGPGADLAQLADPAMGDAAIADPAIDDLLAVDPLHDDPLSDTTDRPHTTGHPHTTGQPGTAGHPDDGDQPKNGVGKPIDRAARPLVFANGFTLSPYAETGGPGGNPKKPPRTLWHASPGSTTTPN